MLPQHPTAPVQDSLMVREAREAAEVCEQQVAENAAQMRELGAMLRRLNAPFAATLARGSSDQAAAFAKVLFETRAATPVVSQSPSLGGIYRATSLRFQGVPLFAISQSGRSPDLLAAAEDAQRRGALVVALTNDADSPLSRLADRTIPLGAGIERSVAATKTFIASLVALAHLTAEWAQDVQLLDAVTSVGPALRRAREADWTFAAGRLSGHAGLLVLGRGLTLPIAGEASLKLKETAGLHAEAFSSAEVAHGPTALIKPGRPVLIFSPFDEARTGLRERIRELAARGATVVAAGPEEDITDAAVRLPTEAGLHPVVGSIACIQSFYPLAAAAALWRGYDPDQPQNLRKVTLTI